MTMAQEIEDAIRRARELQDQGVDAPVPPSAGDLRAKTAAAVPTAGVSSLLRKTADELRRTRYGGPSLAQLRRIV